MPRPPVAPHPIRIAAGARRARPFALAPDGAERAALASDLDISAITVLGFRGTLAPEGREDWRLDARLTATVVQRCVITLEPVTTRIDEPVSRRYLADWQEPRGDEAEIPEDDSAEALPDVVDPALVMVEALTLALPAYPRAPGAGAGPAAFAAPGDAPAGDGMRRPFAGLGELLGDAAKAGGTRSGGADTGKAKNRAAGGAEGGAGGAGGRSRKT